MYRYTTPTLPITIDDVDFTTVDLFRIAIENDKTSLLFIVSADDPRVDAQNKTIAITLTQEQTAQFCEGEAVIQARIKYLSNSVQATKKAKVRIYDVLDEVII